MKDKLKTETPNQPINSAFRFSRMLANVRRKVSRRITHIENLEQDANRRNSPNERMMFNLMKTELEIVYDDLTKLLSNVC